MEEKVTYQVGVNIIGINEYVEHFIPVDDVDPENIENSDLENVENESDIDEDLTTE